ncbi:unnamed protein product [Calypogeia fissa]
MRKFFSRGGHHPKSKSHLLLRELKGCLQPLESAQNSESCEPNKRLTTGEQPLLTSGDDDGFLSARTGLVITVPPLYFGASSAEGRFVLTHACAAISVAEHSRRTVHDSDRVPRMLAPSTAQRTLFRQGLHRLLGPGDGVVGGQVRAQVRAQVMQNRWVSFIGFSAAGISLDSDSLSRGFSTKAKGRRKNDAEMVTGDGVKQKGPKTKRQSRSVEANGAHLSSDKMPGAEDALLGPPSMDNCGGIHVIIGPMFAGKSTALLRRVQEEASVGRKVVLVKSDKDTRYGLSSIVTHDGLQMPCYAVPDLATFKTKVGGKFYKELDVIGIDEAQFFSDLYEFCQHAADFEGKTIIVAGLDGDFLRRKFGSTLDLIPVADSVVKLSSRCEICGRPAIFSFRKTLETHTELVGGADVYMPVCRQHFVNGQIVVETASTVLGARQVAQMNNE